MLGNESSQFFAELMLLTKRRAFCSFQIFSYSQCLFSNYFILVSGDPNRIDVPNPEFFDKKNEIANRTFFTDNHFFKVSYPWTEQNSLTLTFWTEKIEPRNESERNETLNRFFKVRIPARKTPNLILNAYNDWF